MDKWSSPRLCFSVMPLSHYWCYVPWLQVFLGNRTAPPPPPPGCPILFKLFTLQAVLFAVIFISLFGVLRRFQHCTGHITTASWKGRGNQYIQFVRVLYCKLLTNGNQLPAFPLEAVPGIEPRPQSFEARVLPLCHHGPFIRCL